MSERPGFWFCVCPDPQLTRRQIDTMLQTHAPQSGAWEKHVFWGDEEPGDAFWEALTLQGLFDSCRAVVIRRANNFPAEIWKRVSKTLSRPNAKVWPLLCLEVPWEKGQPKIAAHIAKLACLDFAQSKGWVWRSPGLDQRSLPTHLRQTAKQLGLALNEQTIAALCAVLPADAATVDAELEKLFLLAGHRELAPDDAAVAAVTPEFNIFSLLRLLEAGRPAATWGELKGSGAGGDEALFPLLGLLQREARQLWQILAGEQPRLYPAERERKERLAARLGYPGLGRLWEAMHAAELSVKSGRQSPEQVLDELTARLTLLFGTDSNSKGH